MADRDPDDLERRGRSTMAYARAAETAVVTGVRGPGSEVPSGAGTSEPHGDRRAPLELISGLCRALDEGRVRYCHWKSNEALARSASGENDLDLLVSRSDAARFEEILRRFGFKDARLPRWKELPGIWHTYALDEASGTLVHIHAHYRLVVGDDMTKTYHLPIEEPYLDSAIRAEPFMVPDPRFELAVFLVRMVLKHGSWDAIVSLQGSLSASERRELGYLLDRADPEEAWSLLHRHLPLIDRELWERCLRAVQPGCAIGFRVRTAGRLARRLAPVARRGRGVDTYLKLWRRGRTFVRRRLFRLPARPMQLGSAGLLIAIVGGDGAGKSTAVEDLSRVLGKGFRATTIHLGKPRRSPLSAVVKGAMHLAASVRRSSTSSAAALRTSLAGSNGGPMGPRNVARLVWEVLTARDRYRAFRRARRAASNGAIVVCDRYPIPEIELMDGAVSARMADPAGRGRVVGYLARLERRYYDRIPYPDLLIVLRVHPDLAVLRKREERESYLRPRSEEIWRKDWSGTPAIVVDAGRPKAEVLSEIRSLVWSRL